MLTPEHGQFYAVESTVMAVALVAVGVFALLAVIQRRRPGLAIGKQTAVALAARITAALLVPVLGAGSLRGGDEKAFLAAAQSLNHGGLLSQPSIDVLTSKLHIWVIALELRLFDFSELGLRIVQIGFAVAGLALLAAAVYELAGAKAARLCAWLLAFEPASVFFSGLLHKESLMLFAGGLVVFGGANIWSRHDFRGLVPMLLGGAVGVCTRPYAGWFLVAAGAATLLHATTIRRGERQGLALVIAAVVAVLVGLSVPTVLHESSDQKLQQTLQVSQEANSSDQSNLSLEQVDYSSRGAAILNLPIRIRDVLTRPYPWQVQTTSQRLGLLGTLATLAFLWFLARAILSNPREVLSRAGPPLYAGFFLLVAYSLSSGNAGTSFRYRTHLIALGICVVVVLRARIREIAAARQAELVAAALSPAASTTPSQLGNGMPARPRVGTASSVALGR